MISARRRLRRLALLALVAALGAACSAGSSNPWRETSAGALGRGLVRVVHVASGPDGVLGVGSVTEAGRRVPAAWRSADGLSWQRLQVVPRTPYGFESELTTVASGGSTAAAAGVGAAAIGQAVGGAHGNPRIASWYLDGTTLTEVPADVELYGGPRQGSVDEMAAGPSGFVVVGTRTLRNDRTGAAAWTSPDARTPFTIVDADPALESTPDETVRALAVAGGPSGYLAAGDRYVSGTGRLDSDAVFWTSSDGRVWSRFDAGDPALVAGSGSELPERAVAWRDGWAVAGTDSAGGRTTVVVWSSADGRRWQRADVGAVGGDADPLSAVTGLAVADGKLVVGARLGTRLAVADSTDGGTWRRLDLPSDIGGAHGIVAVAAAGPRLVVAATGDDVSTRLWSLPATAL